MTRWAGGLAITALLLVACGSDEVGRAPATSTSAAFDVTPYPPSDFDELAAIFEPQIADMGLRLTRGGLIDRSGGGYRESDTGQHLAL